MIHALDGNGPRTCHQPCGDSRPRRRRTGSDRRTSQGSAFRRSRRRRMPDRAL